MKIFGLCAQFQKSGNKPLELFSLSVRHETEGWPRGTKAIALDHYDIDHSKKYGYCISMSGSGGRDVQVCGPYFKMGKIDAVETRTTLVDRREEPDFNGPLTAAIREANRTRRLSRLPREFRGCGGLWKWLERNAIWQSTVYCSICNDRFPDDEHCEHIWWCEDLCWWSTPSEPCGHAIRDICDGEDNAERNWFVPKRPRLLESTWWED